jgi:uncharacterized protein (DUF58 family)
MEGEKMNSIKAIPKSSWAILIAALIVVGTLIIYFGAWIGVIFLCAVAALVLYLNNADKSKTPMEANIRLARWVLQRL